MPPTRQHRCSIVELSSHRAAGSVHLHFPPTIVSFDTQHRPRSFPPSVPSRGCVWRAMPGGCRCFGCIVHTSAKGMVKDRTGRWRGCPVGNTRAVGLPLGLKWPPRCAMSVLWVLLGGRSASPAFGNPEQHPGTARGRLGAGFAFLLDLISSCRRPKPGGGAPRPPKFPSGAPWVMCWLWMSLMAAPHPPAKCQSAQVCGKVVCYRKHAQKSTKHSPNGALCGKWPLLVLPHSKQPQGDHMGHSTGVVSHFVLYLTYLSLPPSTQRGPAFSLQT